jgi:hypothetical protein
MQYGSDAVILGGALELQFNAKETYRFFQKKMVQ